MRNPLRTAVACVVALGMPGTLTCWFSSTSPKPGDSTPAPDDPTSVVVTGLVQLFDRSDHHMHTAPGWTVRASWYVRSGVGDPIRLDHRDLDVSGRDGVYQVRASDPDLVAVDLQARVCEYEPCCTDDPACDLPVCRNAWTPPVRVDVTPGVREHRNLVVGCDHAP